MMWTIQKKVAVGFALILLILAVVGTGIYTSMNASIESANQVEHSHRVIAMLEDTLSQMKDVETGQRGYTITRNKAFLEPYELATQKIPQNLKDLRALTVGSPEQQRRIENLEPLINEKISFSRTLVELTEKQGFAAALGKMESLQGKEAMEAIRRIAAQMKAEERDLLQERKRATDESVRNTVLLAAIGAIIVFISLLILYYLINKETQVRTLAEQALEKARREAEAAKENYRSLIEGIRDYAIIRLDPNGLVQTWNAGAEGIKGYKAEEIIGRHFSQFYEEEDIKAGKTEVELQEARVKGRFEDEGWRVRKDGSRFWARVVVTALRSDEGELIGFSKITQDLTARKQMEDELRRAKEEALLASRMKSDFLANMSHEIRTPMNGILGMTEIALHTELTDDQRRYLGMVQSSGRALLSIINDILDFSKIEAGKMELDPVDFKFRDAMGEIMQSFSQRATEKGLELIYQVNPDVPDYVVGDVIRLRQIITNLVGNALKFTERGEIFVGVDPQSNGGNDVHLLFKVSDTGIGLSVEQQNRIFDPFTQVDGSQTRKYRGTGLGLSITLQLVEMMGGRIWVESEPGRGSTFFFTVRLGIQKNPAEAPVPIDTEKLAGMTVLIVDDNHTNLQVVEQLVSLWDMKPTTFDNGKPALEELGRAVQENRPYDLVLMDYDMPGMDGLTLARAIKTDPGLSGTKLVMLSSYSQPGDIAECRALNIEGYLTKPIGQNELLSVIRMVFGYARSEEGEAEKTYLKRMAVGPGELPLKILLAEDNEVNQEVAVHILTEAGHAVIVANNGKEALDRLKEQSFDMILMDIQMPEMDGFEATAAIRIAERETGRYTPIIALTANAIKGDRERCLEAGMDGYVSKPFQKKELLDALQSLSTMTPGRHDTVATVEKYHPSNGLGADHIDEILDLERIQDKFDDDKAILGKVIGVFRGKCPEQLATIQEAIEKRDGELLRVTAHSLKGAIGNFTGKAAYEAALKLENLGRDGDFDHAPDVLAHLKAELQKLEVALDSVITS